MTNKNFIFYIFIVLFHMFQFGYPSAFLTLFLDLIRDEYGSFLIKNLTKRLKCLQAAWREG